MNFFEHQERANQNTFYLIGLFGVAIATMIILLYGAIAWIWTEKLTWQPELFAIVALGTIACIGSGSLYKLIQLRAGGKVVAEDLGGTLVQPMTDNAAEQRLLNIVEEISIASGVPVPAVYVLHEEQGINAFAAGFTPSDAVIGVTRGCLETLDRDELQGVIAHEFSHILNGDMRLNLRLIGVLQGILVIYLLGRTLLRVTDSSGRSSSSNDKRNAILMMGLAMLAIGGIGFICGRLIKSAVSRQREFLADASAVQFTRNPQGIGNALRKIGGYGTTSEIRNPKAEEASHLFFEEAVETRQGFFGQGKGIFSNFGKAFSTHPPIEERIRRVEGFIGKVSSFEGQSPRSVSPASTDERVAGFTGASSPKPAAKKLSVSPNRVVAGVGTTNPKHLQQVQRFLAQLPEEVRTATRNPNGAIAIVYSLLLDTDAAIGVSEAIASANRQRQLLRKSDSAKVLEIMETLQPHLEKLDPRTRLPLIDLIIPALRQLSEEQFARFYQQVKALIQADKRQTLSEYAVLLVLRQRLSSYFLNKRQDKIVQFTQMSQIWPDCITVLSALAKAGQESPDAIALAFRSGLFRLPGASKQTLPKEPVNCSLTEVGKSLKRLELATPKLKQSVVDACAYTVLMDQKVNLEEAELLRAIVISLNCPIPPFLDAPA
jgi:Zn-dependent protease with chaperone function